MKKLVAPLAVCLCLTMAGCTSWKNSSLSPDERAEDLLNELTLEEKVQLMTDVNAPIERLGIKQYNWWNEALHGIARNGLATVFPMPIGMAASFNPDLVHQVFVVASDEARAKNTKAKNDSVVERYQGLTVWTPNINIFRDPRWGRGIETYGEDPYLTSVMGVEVVKGLQCLDANEKYEKMNACAKHFAVHSGPEWARHKFNAENLNPRDLYETYLAAFESLVKDGHVREVMCAYNRVEGEPCCGSDKLLTHILRNEWGYDGLVVSDCGAINDFFTEGAHEVSKDEPSASAKAVLSGTDLSCGSSYLTLVEAVKNGQILEGDIDISVRRILKARFALGEMDDDSKVSWSKIPFSVVACAEHDSLSLRMARETITLLQNKDNILPLPRGGQTIVVMGPNANDSVMQWGNYNGIPPHTLTLLDGIRLNMAKDDSLIYVENCPLIQAEPLGRAKIDSILNLTKTADVVVFAGGISPRLEGEEMGVELPGFRGGDRTNIELPAVQRQVLEALAKQGKKTVLVNFSGSAIGFVPETQTCDAILQAWYPGQQGGQAIADVLFGNYNPAGRLPVTFYRNIGQVPDFLDYNMTGRTYRFFDGNPLYPFGYGLSYTTFAYGDIQCDTEAAAGETVKVTVAVTNTGSRDGDEVVQLYMHKHDDANGPTKALRAFKRVHIPAGETLNVTLELTPKQLAWWDEATHTITNIPGTFDIMVGPNSAELQTKSITIK